MSDKGAEQRLYELSKQLEDLYYGKFAAQSVAEHMLSIRAKEIVNSYVCQKKIDDRFFHRAAQIWCEGEHAQKEMDAFLAISIAKALAEAHAAASDAKEAYSKTFNPRLIEKLLAEVMAARMLIDSFHVNSSTSQLGLNIDFIKPFEDAREALDAEIKGAV